MKLKQNNKYTTIAIYFVSVFIICLLIYRVVFNWNEVVFILKNIIRILSPFITALMIAYFSSPMLNFFEQKLIEPFHIRNFRLKSAKVKRVLAIIMSYMVILGTTSLLLSFVVPQVGESISEIANKLQNIDQVASDASKWLEERTFTFAGNTYKVDFETLQSYVSEYIPVTLQQLGIVLRDFMPNIIDATANIAVWLKNLLLGLIIAVYLLFNKESYAKSTQKVATALLPPRQNQSFLKIARESHKIFTGFFVGKLVDSLIIGIMCFVAMVIFNMNYAVLISVIVGITNMIPYFGPFIGGAVGILFILIVSPIKALWFAILILALQQFDGNILGPKILGDSTGLTPVWVIFSVLVFGSVFGVMGMFIGVPCFAVIKNIFDHIINKKYEARLSQTSFEEIN